MLSGSDLAQYILLSVALLGAVLSIVFRWLFAGPDNRDLLAWTGVSIFGGMIILNQMVRWTMLGIMRRPAPAPPPPVARVAVVTTFVPGAEPLALLERSVEALVALDVPHDTWILDEGDDPAAREICGRHHAFYYTRKHKPEFQKSSGKFASGSKHGNYNAWLTEVGFSRYSIVSAFDVDHVPATRFLREILGYFEDPSIGYVQAAQAYSNQNASFIAQGAAEETYEFYSVVQMANNHLGYPTVIGCHNTHRMQALAGVEGFAAHDADDLLITLKYNQAGWRGVYIPRILARGLAPEDWATYLMQQRRWSRSVLDLKLRRQWAYLRNLPPLSRVAAMLLSLNYLAPLFLGLLGIVVLLWMLTHRSAATVFSGLGVSTTAWLVLMFALCGSFRQRFYLNRLTESGVPWRSWLLRFAKWPFLLWALVDVLRNKRFDYLITPKVPQNSGSNVLIKAHLPGLALVGAVWLLTAIYGGPVSTVASMLAGMFVVFTTGLIASGWMRSPRGSALSKRRLYSPRKIEYE